MAREISITVEANDVETLRDILKDRLRAAWPQKPNPDTIGTDQAALQELSDELAQAKAIADKLIELAGL